MSMRVCVERECYICGGREMISASLEMPVCDSCDSIWGFPSLHPRPTPPPPRATAPMLGVEGDY